MNMTTRLIGKGDLMHLSGNLMAKDGEHFY